MTESSRYLLIRYGVIVIGLVMLYSVIRGTWTGKTRGYYADHSYCRVSNRESFANSSECNAVNVACEQALVNNRTSRMTH